MVIEMIWAIVGAFALTAFLVPLVKLLAVRLGAVDKPNARKVHATTTPRMGGLAIYAAFWIVIFLVLPIERMLIGFFIGATFLIFVGIVDDITDMPAKLKLLGQIIAAGMVTYSGARIDFVTGFFGTSQMDLRWLAAPVTVIWIVGVINAVNLIDGLDGLAAGISGIAATTMGIVSIQHNDWTTALLCFTLLGTCLGFLLYNFNPASIFMGDTGSMFLGYVLAVLSVMGASKGITFVSVFTPILILGIPLFDTLFAILRRMLNNKPIFEADKAHLHHCLLKRGFSHRNTVLLIYAVSIALSVCALIINRLTTEQGFLVLVLASTVILIGANKLGILGNHYKKPDAGDENEKERKKL